MKKLLKRIFTGGAALLLAVVVLLVSDLFGGGEVPTYNEGNDTQPPVQSETLPTPSEEADSGEGDYLLPEDGSYFSKEEVALYIHTYGHLPSNFITKSEARELGWEGGSVERYAPGKAIGGDRFGNYEGQLPEAAGRTYTECDIGTLGKDERGARRIVFSNDGLIYYTDDHYVTFELLYGEE